MRRSTSGTPVRRAEAGLRGNVVGDRVEQERPQESWSSGDAYEAYVGRWSRPVARQFVDWLGVAGGSRWLDVGCGTGALTGAVAAGADPAEVVGVDASSAYVEEARRRLGSQPVRFQVADAAGLDFHEAFDAAVSGLVLNFLPDPGRVVGAMRRAVVPRGVVAAYVWDYVGGMELIRHFWDGAARVDGSARLLDEGVRFPECRPGPLADLWERVGLSSVETTAIDVPTAFADFDDFWSPFLGGQGPAPGYLMSQPEDRRVAVREAVRASLPVAADGSIELVARAWAVRGRAGPPRLAGAGQVAQPP